MRNEGNLGRIEFAVSDYTEIGSLHAWLDLTPEVQVLRNAGQPQPGEQGALDVLTIVASSSTLVAACRTIPEFLRSRRSDISITTTVRGGEQLTLNANNVDDVMAILERLLDD